MAEYETGMGGKKFLKRRDGPDEMAERGMG